MMMHPSIIGFLSRFPLQRGNGNQFSNVFPEFSWKDFFTVIVMIEDGEFYTYSSKQFRYTKLNSSWMCFKMQHRVFSGNQKRKKSCLNFELMFYYETILIK